MAKTAKEFREFYGAFGPQQMISIAIVDRAIDAVTAELQRREGLSDSDDYIAWGNAWERNPRLSWRHKQLYARRGRLQVERDTRNEIAWRKAQRRKAAEERAAAAAARPKQCPTCGQFSYAA